MFHLCVHQSIQPINMPEILHRPLVCRSPLNCDMFVRITRLLYWNVVKHLYTSQKYTKTHEMINYKTIKDLKL